jgi:hypothetical protein
VRSLISITRQSIIVNLFSTSAEGNRPGIFALIFILIWFEAVIKAQDADYRILFGSHWETAEDYVTANEKWMRQACENHDISYPFAVAIIFPELVRYSALRDRIEISLLKTLYINLGEEYADFSVGPFQMKPSFAETVIERVFYIDDRSLKKKFRSETSFKEERDFRSSIVKSLEDQENEFYYLIAFIKLCDKEFASEWGNLSEKLAYYSTAYNCGLDKDKVFIKNMMGKKFFSIKIFKGETYSYSDVSRFWYESSQIDPKNRHN